MVPTWIQPEALQTALVHRGACAKVLMSTGGAVVAPGSVLGQAVADDGEDMRPEVGDLDPGQDEEPRVLDDQGDGRFGMTSASVIPSAVSCIDATSLAPALV